MQPWTWEPSPNQYPDITPLDRWYSSIPSVRDAGAVVTEYFFWGPDDFGNLTPDEAQWFSGQGNYLITQADVHAVIDAAHANGLAAVTYGKNIMSTTGLQVNRDGAELTRRHPEWAQWMCSGEPKWAFDVSRYRMSFDQVREQVQLKGKGWSGWNLVAVNCGDKDAVQFGADEIVRSAKKYGWDGIRFDDHFTMESVFNGGVNFDGSIYERGEDFEALTERNNQIMIDTARVYSPHFLLGYNYGTTYHGRGVRYPDAFAQTCRDGQFVMIEHSGWWNGYRTWPEVIDELSAGQSSRARLRRRARHVLDGFQ